MGTAGEGRRRGAWRQAVAIALLPGTVVVLVPLGVLAAADWEFGWGLDDGLAIALALIGLGLVLAGFGLWLWTVRLFARVGKGTLAPWDPPRNLVVEGPYRHVRNPMIAAVLAVLAGEVVVFSSPALLVWFAFFLLANYAFFRLHEEPGLERRFGEEYKAYKRAVPRWVPRRKPWTPGAAVE